MSWKKVAYIEDVATLSDSNPEDVIVQSASPGSGTQAARIDHKHNLGAHATAHKSGGGDEIKLNEFAIPDGTINVNSQMLTNARLEAAASYSGTPADGGIFFDTDDDHVYVYVA